MLVISCTDESSPAVCFCCVNTSLSASESTVVTYPSGPTCLSKACGARRIDSHSSPCTHMVAWYTPASRFETDSTHTHTTGRAQARPPNLECLPSLSTYTIHSLLHFSLCQESLCCNHSLACLTCTTELRCATPSLSSPFSSEPLFNVAPCCKLWGAFCYSLLCGYCRGALGLTAFHLPLLAIFTQHEGTVIQL